MRDRALTEDRDRIARDLHDSVIQRLFAIGLSLQGTARLVERPEAVMRIGEAIDKLDETIRQLRKAIFDIELTINKEGLHPKVLDLVHELRPVLGIHPHVSFSGPVDKVVTGALAEEVLAVLRETLTNVGKHANASQVVVTITAGDQLRLVVADDGIGIGDVSRPPASDSGTCASGRSGGAAAWTSAPHAKAGPGYRGTSRSTRSRRA